MTETALREIMEGSGGGEKVSFVGKAANAGGGTVLLQYSGRKKEKEVD